MAMMAETKAVGLMLGMLTFTPSAHEFLGAKRRVSSASVQDQWPFRVADPLQQWIPAVQKS